MPLRDLEKDKARFIGDRIGICFDEIRAAIAKYELTLDELDKFARFIEHQDSFMPFFDPTLYQKPSTKWYIVIGRERTALMITLVKHIENTRKGLQKILGIEVGAMTYPLELDDVEDPVEANAPRLSEDDLQIIIDGCYTERMDLVDRIKRQNEPKVKE